MPKLGADMDRGKVMAWRKRPGEAVTKGEILLDVETDKAAVEVESYTDGVLEEVLIPPGERVPVGTLLARLRLPGEAAPPAPPPVHPEGSRVSATPAARRRAAELGLDLATLQGHGPGGRIQLEDVEPPATAMAPPPPTAPEDRALRMRQAIASAMARSKREIPHYYLSHTLDLGPAALWLAQTNAARPVDQRLLLGALLLKATALALREVPELNGFWEDGAFRPGTGIHLGLAVSLRQGGLIAPALHDADRAPLEDLNARMADLVARARTGALRSSELTEATVTVTSLGERGVEAVFGIIHPPQVALVGLGKVVERPWVVQGRLEPRLVVTATLAADHRASDGHRGGRMLATLDRLLQSPEVL
ncbi:MAG TPA: dihydrolipoamide acetyltransferase family protein [Holophagaceae bacterium]|nr:dihydrolipoamide acetyltransferase family protein [Holophagaceae bacterium]